MNDTPPDVEARYLRRLLQLTPAQRLRRGFQMRAFVRRCVRAGIRAQHPDWSECQVEMDLLRRLYADEVSPDQMSHMQRRIAESLDGAEERASR